MRGINQTVSRVFHIKAIFQDNCPAGCPCDDYPCAETTTAPEVTTATTPATTTSPITNAILVLSTSNAANKPMVIEWDGKRIFNFKNVPAVNELKLITSGNYNDDLNFEFGEGTTIFYGCGATLMDQFWYFGGYGSDNNRQVNSFNNFYYKITFHFFRSAR